HSFFLQSRWPATVATGGSPVAATKTTGEPPVATSMGLLPRPQLTTSARGTSIAASIRKVLQVQFLIGRHREIAKDPIAASGRVADQAVGRSRDQPRQRDATGGVGPDVGVVPAVEDAGKGNVGGLLPLRRLVPEGDARRQGDFQMHAGVSQGLAVL